ncbi:MAG: hypothetical protein PHS65_05695 [Arcobacteraceae bacterium]|nr:hypothetical protein [Arcobacteraceae bacterium]
MKIKSFIFLFVISLLLSGCGIGVASYEVFERNRNHNIGNKALVYFNQKNRKAYDKNHYIYEYPKGCTFGFLTNRDNKEEKVVDWIILSGKEYCKEQEKWILSF